MCFTNFNGLLHHVWNRNVGLFNDASSDSVKELNLWHFHGFLYRLNGALHGLLIKGSCLLILSTQVTARYEARSNNVQVIRMKSTGILSN